MKRFNSFTLTIAATSLVFAFTVMSGGVAGAASYQQIDGTIVDPIQCYDGCGSGAFPYSGNNLEPLASLEFADLLGADLYNANLTGANLSSANLDYANLIGASLSFANLSGASMFGPELAGADLSGALMNGVVLEVSNAPGANFTGASLVDAHLGSNILTGANFSNANLTSVEFFFSTLTNANLTGANLTNAYNLQSTTTVGGGAFYDINTNFTGTWADYDKTIPFDPVAAGWTLVPIPEPNSAILIGIGLSALAVRRENR
jgi:hypothetical protein